MRRATRRKVLPATDKVMPTGKPRAAVKKVTRDTDELPADEQDTFDDAGTDDVDLDATDGAGSSESSDGGKSTVTTETDKAPSPTGGIVERRDRRRKRGGSGKRVTEKATPSASTRYTPPSARYEDLPSPMWVPILMFTMFGAGMLTIFLNYVGLLPGETSNWYLLLGLGFILSGIITATQYR
jgi:hypothetical protein